MARAHGARPTTSSRSRSRRSGRARSPIDRDGEPLHDAIIWMDARGADETRARRRAVAVRLQGYEPRKLRTWIKLHRRRARALGQGLDRAHPLAAARAPRHRARDVEVPRAEGLAELQAHRRVRGDATTRSSCTGSPTTATSRASTTTPSCCGSFGVDRAQLPDLVAGDRRCSAPLRRAPRRELGVPAGIPVVGGTPDLQSAAIGSGAVRDFEGHLYVGTSSWLTCHVPFKKTDLFHGIASLPSPLPGKYYVADEQEVAGGCLELAARQRAVPTTRCDDLAPTTRLCSTTARVAPPGATA